MIAGMARLMMLAVFSGLSMNLILQFGLGLVKITLIESSQPLKKIDLAGAISKMGILFVSTLLLWLLFTFFRSVIPLGLIEYVLPFPSAYLVFSVLEYAADKFILKKNTAQEKPSTASVRESGMINSALAAAALFMALNVAGGFGEAAVLSLCFSGGIALAVLIIREIRFRSEMEAVPQFLRGSPLTLVTMGLLSLIFSSAALMLYKVLEAG